VNKVINNKAEADKMFQAGFAVGIEYASNRPDKWKEIKNILKQNKIEKSGLADLFAKWEMEEK